jgi:hypothetical protein
MDPTLNDDQAPSYWDALPVQQPQPAPPCRPWRQADMLKTMQAIGGTTHDIDKAMLAMDAHIGQNPDQAYPIQSERCDRKSRLAELKQKARHIPGLWQSHSSTSHQNRVPWKKILTYRSTMVLGNFGLCDFFFPFAYCAYYAYSTYLP